MTVQRDRGGDTGSLDDATIYQQENVTKATMKNDSIVQMEMGFSFSNTERHENTTKNH